MSVENEQIIPVQVKYVEVQSATVLRNEKIPSTAPRKIPERQQNGDGAVLQNGVCRSPVAAENIEISHGSPVMSPCAGSPTNPLTPNKFQFDPNLTYAEKVAHEMLVTEKIYLDNLKQIIDGFLGPVASDAQLDVSQENIDDLFINVEEIYQFNWVLLQDMEKCNYDPVKLAECFVVKQIGFDIYTKYCTHYPRSMEVLLEWNQREDTANFIKRQQESLGHTLPLCSFLLKPVQRILKYHLLLGNIAKHFKQSEDEDGYEIIQKALSAMTNVAKHINDMKRKHEDALHLQEIQSVLLDYEGPNLTSFGSIVLEDTFRLHGTKTGRYLFLFEKALLITKRRSDGTFSWKATVMYSNMMLADSVFREPLTFQVIPFDDRKICHTFVSRDLDTKHVWLLELKRRLLDSYAAAVPMKAKQMILGNGRENNEKENAEPDSVRRSTTRKGANQQRQQPGKENSAQSTKLSKTVDSQRRKYKDIDATIEEKTKMSIDSFKSPLRRKLRVFKKRKFSSKESAKSPKRVSWSSDDNNDESFIDKESLAMDKENTNQERKVSTNSEPQYDANDEEKQNISEKKYRDNNDNEVSISSLLHDGKTMVSVTGEVDNHLSSHVKLRGSHENILPLKKRRLTREKRQKCKSMPAGQFPMVNEFVTVDKNESTLTRAHSLSRLYEKFLESELIDTPSSVKELEKYGLVNFQENHTRTKRLGSYDEQLASEEGNIHRSSGDVIASQTDDVIPKTGQSVQQTMKRVSMAFSDISANFSTEKSPASSIDDLTTEDIEDLTAGDLTPDEYNAGDLTPEEDTPGDLSLDDGDTGSPIPDKMFNAEKSPEDPNPVEGGVSRDINGYNDTDKNEDSGLNYKENMENGVTTDWNESETANNTYNQESIYEDPSNQDRNTHSEPNSYTDVFSDDSWAEQSDQSWLSNVSGSYQRVFTLKRSYSEENLVSKYPFDEGRLEDEPTDVASKSYTHFDHAPIVRSKSADCSKKPQSRTRPFTFSVTPKKKIVIRDSLWETIREHSETTPHEISVANDVYRFRRQKKRKSGHKKSKKNRTQSSDGRVEGRQHVVRTCAVLNMADYRQPKDENCAKRDLKNKPVHRKDSLISQKNKKNECVSTLASSSENVDNVPESTASNLQETFGSNNENITQNSQEESANSTELKKPGDAVTNIAVAMRKKKPKASTSQEESLISVDKNMSEVLPTVNYLCIETFPTEELSNTEEEPGASSRDIERTNGNTASKVERLSKYFSKVTTENHKRNDQHMINHAETLRKGCSIKKRVEELSKHETHNHKSGLNSEENVMVEGDSTHNIQNRVGGLRRSSSSEGQTTTKSRIELTSSLHHGKPNVRELKNRLEDTNHSCETNNKSSNGISKKVSTSLRIKNRIQELEQNPDKTPEHNVDDDLRACTRLKERIEQLQKGGKRHELDTERDITISDDHDTSQTSPRQNEELRTVVIKRGWVQQFIQKIETGS